MKRLFYNTHFVSRSGRTEHQFRLFLGALTAFVCLFAVNENKLHAQNKTSYMDINITVSGRTFVAEVEDSETGCAFVEMLPMTLDMNELNGNEKYYYMSKSLPTAAQFYNSISAGDLMLYGNTCVVLFYGKAGGYSYTRIGRLKSTDGLAAAVGNGKANVKFEAIATSLKSPSKAQKDAQEIHWLDGKKLTREPEKGIYI